ncbi:MAG: FAD-binding protein [Candidatus Wildermuthbacteria bacterium]|nr:FAD-binding protein [Candidatus Wildermuthbacteria bacterium]
MARSVAIFGVFDGVHKGHRDFLRQAKSHGDTLVAIVGRDAVVEKIKSKTPRFSQEQRMDFLRAEKLADTVVLGDEELSSYRVLDQARPDVLCLGYDQESLEKDIREWMKKKGISLPIVRLHPYWPGAYHTSLLEAKNGKNNFQVNDDFSSLVFNQTDFGRIYYNLPKEIAGPVTPEELASTLAFCHKAGKSVTVRNTGHSVNGQTLTKETQVNIGNMKGVWFDEERFQVTARAGASWHEVLKAIRFPEYAVPVMPNNPGQQIKIGGTLAVGGEGFASSKQGGLWNHVVSLKLVTMTGDILECSRTKNPLYFQYALGGFGRIGVIAEATIKVQKSTPYQLGMMLCCYHGKSYYSLLQKIASDPMCDSLTLMEYIGGFGVFSRLLQGIVKKSAWPRCLVFFKDVRDKQEDLLSFVRYMKKTYGERFALYAEYKRSTRPNFDLTFHPHLVKRTDAAYFYPQGVGENQLDLFHPWLDCIVPGSLYEDFVDRAKALIKKYKMEKYLVREALFAKRMDLPLFGTYMIKNISKDFFFFLSLDLPGQEYAFGVSILSTVPSAVWDASFGSMAAHQAGTRPLVPVKQGSD